MTRPDLVTGLYCGSSLQYSSSRVWPDPLMWWLTRCLCSCINFTTSSDIFSSFYWIYRLEKMIEKPALFLTSMQHTLTAPARTSLNISWNKHIPRHSQTSSLLVYVLLIGLERDAVSSVIQMTNLLLPLHNTHNSKCIFKPVSHNISFHVIGC